MIIPAERTRLFSEYYFSRKLREIRELQNSGRSIINLGIGSPDLPPAKEVTLALSKYAELPHIHGYQPYQGIAELHSAIKSFYASKYKCDVSALSVLPLLGSKEGITHISLAYLNPGDQVLIPDLGYPTYTSVTKMVGAEPVYYPLNEDTYQPDWEALEKMDTSAVKIMWLNYPHMPTGAKADLALFQKYVAFAQKNQILLCHDNPYSFIGNEEPLNIFNVEGADEVAVELNSLSKTFNMAGWRVGWVLGKEELLKPILQIKSNMDSGMFYGVQQAAVAALSLGDDWFAQVNDTYKSRRVLGERIFDQLGCDYRAGQVGMFLWAKAPKSGEDFIEEILDKYDVFLAPGFIFGESGRYFVRMSLCASADKLEEVYNRIK